MSDNTNIPATAVETVASCSFSEQDDIRALRFRETPYWHRLLTGRHIGIHRPDARICNWTARILTREKRYQQKCLGPALSLGRGSIGYHEAIRRAFEWFSSGDVVSRSFKAQPVGRTKTINVCPLGDIYTVGHALRDYTEWSEIARAPGTHYNNLILINYHLVPHLSPVPLGEFTTQHLVVLARRILATPPTFGFKERLTNAENKPLSEDELRRRKRTFNSLVTILRMAFKHAWNSGHIDTERPWRCLNRIPVQHAPRTIFLNRDECRRLLKECTPALRLLVLGALYTGCRVGELGILRVEDVGRDGFGIHVPAFKRSPARFVFLPDEGMSFFLAQCEGKKTADHVFLSEKGKIWRGQHANLFRRAVSLAGLPKTFVFHGLRHTYASDLVRSNVPLEVVAKQLGHANTMTVSNTYGHLAEHFREDQVRSRFTPLSETAVTEVEGRRPQLEAVLDAAYKKEWRSYGNPPAIGSSPRKHYAQTHVDILGVFAEGEP